MKQQKYIKPKPHLQSKVYSLSINSVTETEQFLRVSPEPESDPVPSCCRSDGDRRTDEPNDEEHLNK